MVWNPSPPPSQGVGSPEWSHSVEPIAPPPTHSSTVVGSNKSDYFGDISQADGVECDSDGTASPPPHASDPKNAFYRVFWG